MNPKKLLKSGLKYLTSSDHRFLINAGLGFHNKMPDAGYLKRKFKICMGYDLDLEAPKTFNEKLQWLKLYDRRPEYTMMADKVAVRDYIAEKLGEEYLIPCLGVWADPDDIDFDALPDQFVLKCNHNSGLGMCICKDKSILDVKKVKQNLRKGLNQNYYLTGREWVYKDIPRRIIAEKYMTDTAETDTFTDYKFFCFNGNVDSVMVCMERETGNPKFYFFDENWELKRYNKRGLAAPKDFTVPKPKAMDKMFEIAKLLAKDIPHVRVDLYCSDDHVYFGELTFFSESGFDANLLHETNMLWGSKLELPEKRQ